MKRAARRPVAYPLDEVDIVYLGQCDEPPAGERYLMIDWARSGFGCRIEREPSGLRYVVSPDKHAFWISEARHLARRLQLDRVYFRGAPTFGDGEVAASEAGSSA